MKYISNFSDYNSLNEKIKANLNNDLPKIKMNKSKDATIPAEIRAFLDTIAFAEGTHKYPKGGYNTQFTGKQFDSYDDHPREVIKAKSFSKPSTAAGRYQFLSSTWDGVMKGKEFTPKNQDKGAVKLLQRRGSYDPIMKGDLKKAFYNSRQEWASFPWSPYGQGSWFATNDTDRYKVLHDVYWNMLQTYKPNVKIPQLYSNVETGKKTAKIDDDIKVFTDEEKKRVGKKKRGGIGYSKGDSFPFIVGQSNGEKVITLQTALIKLGGSLPVYGVDGLFGPETMGASKYVLSKLTENNIYKPEGTITNQLSKENYNAIVKSAKNEKTIALIAPDFKKAEYDKYSENLPMKDGVILEGDGIYNVNSMINFLTKMKDGKPVKIYHIGDSHIKAPWLTDTIKAGLNADNLGGVTYVKNAENGHKLSDHLREKSKITKDIKNGNYDLVIISLGANDAFKPHDKFSTARYEQRYEQLIDVIRSADENVDILITMPTSGVYPSKTKTPNKNKVLTQSSNYDIASSMDVSAWDIFKKMGGLNSINAWDEKGLVRDGVHFTPSGYKQIGTMLVNDLKKYYDN